MSSFLGTMEKRKKPLLPGAEPPPPPGIPAASAGQPGAIPQAAPSTVGAAVPQTTQSLTPAAAAPPNQLQAQSQAPGVAQASPPGGPTAQAATPFNPQSMVPGAPQGAQTAQVDQGAGGPDTQQQYPWDTNTYESTYDPMQHPGADQSMDEIREQWSDILAQQEAGLNGQLAGLTADESRSSLRAAEMNAAAGGGMGGLLVGGLEQARLGGSIARSQATAAANQQSLELKMALLTKSWQSAEARNDREMQKELQAEMDKTQLEIEQKRQDTQLTMAGMEYGPGDGGAEGGADLDGDGVGDVTSGYKAPDEDEWGDQPLEAITQGLSAVQDAWFAPAMDHLFQTQPALVADRDRIERAAAYLLRAYPNLTGDMGVTLRWEDILGFLGYKGYPNPFSPGAASAVDYAGMDEDQPSGTAQGLHGPVDTNG